MFTCSSSTLYLGVRDPTDAIDVNGAIVQPPLPDQLSAGSGRVSGPSRRPTSRSATASTSTRRAFPSRPTTTRQWREELTVPDPKIEYDKLELTMTITGLTGGWSLGQLGQLRLADSATLQFPSLWNDYKKQATLHILQAQWNLGSRLVFEQSLDFGVEFTNKDGVGQSMAVDNALKLHIIDRPLLKIDLSANLTMDGKFDGRRFDGRTEVTGLKLRVDF
jgi:hypothetical protein